MRTWLHDRVRRCERSKKYLPPENITKPVENVLKNSQAVESRDTKDYLQHKGMRDTLREAILKVMADNSLDALAYPTIRRKANVIGEAQPGTNCRLSSNSALPAIVVPGGFTPDGLPVGLELLGRAWSEPQIGRASCRERGEISVG